MSTRVSYTLAVCLLLIAAVLRFTDLATLPPGLSASEIDDIRIAETARQGRVEVFYNLRGQGREGLYQMMLATATGTGGGLIGYRILSVFAGMITLSLTYALSKRLFGTLAALAALALLSIAMFPVVLSRSIAPETLIPLLVTAVLLALARAMPVATDAHSDNPNTAAFAALGLLLGLGFYVHPASFIIALFSMAFIVYTLIARRPFTRRAISFTWFAVVVMIVIATPYVSSSLQRPALAAAGRLLIDDPDRTFIQTMIAGFNGLFFVGDANPAFNLPGRPLIDLVSGVVFIVGIVAALRCWRQARCMLLLIALLFILPGTLLAPGSPNFLAYTPLLPLIALFFGLGVTTLARSLPRSSRLIAPLGLVVLLGFNLVWTTRDLFGAWQSLPQMQTLYNARLGQLAHHIDLTANEIPTVICTSNLHPPNNPINLTNTQTLALMMHRQDAVLRYADCGTALILTAGGEREQIVLVDGGSIESINPYLRGWIDQGDVLEQPDLPLESVIMLDVADSLAQRIGSFMTTAPVAYEPDDTDDQEVFAPPIRFGGNITFLGYDRDWADTYAPGDVVPVTTYWRVDGFVPPDLRLFTHILADPTSRAAQSDWISVLPATLRPRDIFIQVTYVQLPRRMPRGTYTISVGAYESNTEIRLPVFVGDQPRGARLFLGQITVQGT